MRYDIHLLVAVEARDRQDAEVFQYGIIEGLQGVRGIIFVETRAPQPHEPENEPRNVTRKALEGAE